MKLKSSSRKISIVALENLVSKAIASALALSVVVGGYHFSDFDKVVRAQSAVESVGIRMSNAIDDTVAQLAESVALVGGSYLSALNNAGIYTTSGIQIALGASRDLVSSASPSSLAAAYEGTTPFLERVSGFFSRLFGFDSSDDAVEVSATTTQTTTNTIVETVTTKTIDARESDTPPVQTFAEPQTVIIRESSRGVSSPTRSEVELMIREGIDGLATGGSPALNANQEIVYRSNSLQTDAIVGSAAKGLEALRLSIYNRLVSRLALITDLFADTLVAGNATTTNLTSLNAVVAPSFNAGSSTATSLFAGSLDVSGNISIPASSRLILGPDSNWDYLSNNALVTGASSPFAINAAGLLTLGSGRDTGDGIIFAVGGYERVRISDDGYLGVGTNDPQFPLDVSGLAGATGFVSNIFGRENDNGESVPEVTATGTITFTGEPLDGDQLFLDNGTQGYTFEFDDNDDLQNGGDIAVALEGYSIGTLSNLNNAIIISGSAFAIEPHLLDNYLILSSPATGASGNHVITTTSGNIVVEGFTGGVDGYSFEYTSLAFGRGNELNADNAFSFGLDNTIDSNSFAFGANNTLASTSANSYAFGEGNTISASSEGYIFGRNNQASGNGGFIVGLANEILGGGSVFGSFNSGAGSEAYGFGKGNTLSGDRVYAFGLNNVMSGIESYSFGQTNTVSSNNSLAFGLFNEVSSGASSFALGYSNLVNGEFSVSLGNGNQITASSSFAFGNGLHVNDPSVVQIGVSDSAKITIDEVGSLGIGTTDPSAQLHTTDSVRFAALGSAGANLITDADGNVTVSSDERLKDIQGQFTRGLSALQGVTPITYKWNVISGLETNGFYTGFSAQNVQANIPEAVATDSRGYLTLSDRPILAATVNAIKELNLSLASLTSRISGIEEKISSLETRFASGLTTIDRATGKPSCIYVENGVITSMPGECSAQVPVAPVQAPPQTQGQSEPVESNTVVEEVASSTPEAEVVPVEVPTEEPVEEVVEEPFEEIVTETP